MLFLPQQVVSFWWCCICWVNHLSRWVCFFFIFVCVFYHLIISTLIIRLVPEFNGGWYWLLSRPTSAFQPTTKCQIEIRSNDCNHSRTYCEICALICKWDYKLEYMCGTSFAFKNRASHVSFNFSSGLARKSHDFFIVIIVLKIWTDFLHLTPLPCLHAVISSGFLFWTPKNTFNNYGHTAQFRI